MISRFHIDQNVRMLFRKLSHYFLEFQTAVAFQSPPLKADSTGKNAHPQVLKKIDGFPA